MCCGCVFWVLMYVYCVCVVHVCAVCALYVFCVCCVYMCSVCILYAYAV